PPAPPPARATSARAPGERRQPSRSLVLAVDPLVDARDLTDPLDALAMRHLQDLVLAPVEMVRNVRYLPGERLQGVAQDSPAADSSTSNCRSQSGQLTRWTARPWPLIWL